MKKAKAGRRFRASHFLAIVILFLMMTAAGFVIHWIYSQKSPERAGGPRPNIMGEISSHIREALDRKPDEPRTPNQEPISSYFAEDASLPEPESLEGFSAQTKETLRLRYNLAILKVQRGDTSGAIDAFRSVLEIDPQGAYGRRSFLQIGLIHDQAGRYPEAIENFRKAAALEPLDPLAAHNLGIALLHAGQAQEASVELSRAAKLDGANVGILQNLGNAYAALEQDDLAESSYRAVLSLAPENAASRFNLALMLYKRGDLVGAGQELEQTIRDAARSRLSERDAGRAAAFLGMTEYRRGLLSEAANSFGRAAALHPGNADYRFNKGVAHAKAHENAKAAFAFREVLEIAPNDAAAWFGLGGSLYLEGNRNDAMTAYSKGLAIDSAATAAHFTIGYILFEKGDLAGAEERFRRVIEIGGEDVPRAHVNLGLVYEAKGQLSEAALEYQAGDKKDPRTFYNLGLVLRKTGKLAEAVEAFERAHSLKESEPKYVAVLGDAYLELGRPEAAIASYEKAVKNGMEDFEILIRLAQLSIRLEKLREGEAWVDRAAASAQTSRQRALAYLAQGLLHDRRGDVAEALSSLRDAERENPANADIYYNKGVILGRSLRYDEAVDALRTAIRINPGHAGSHTQLGNIFSTRGLRAEAIREYETAVQIDSNSIEANFNLKELRAQ